MTENLLNEAELEHISMKMAELGLKFANQTPPPIASKYGLKDYSKAVKFFMNISKKCDKMREEVVKDGS